MNGTDLLPSDCDAVEELVALEAMGVLDDADAHTVATHLAECASCRRAAVAYDRAGALVPLAAPEVAPPAALRDRIMRVVYAEMPAARETETWWRAAWRRLPSSRAFALTTVAALAAAVVLAVVAAGRGAMPASRDVAVEASAAFPSETGSLVWSPSAQSGVLLVRGLPAQPPQVSGGVYQLWLVPSSGGPQPAGFLTWSAATGEWTGAVHVSGGAAYRAVAATVERPGGSATPSPYAVFQVPLPQS